MTFKFSTIAVLAGLLLGGLLLASPAQAQTTDGTCLSVDGCGDLTGQVDYNQLLNQLYDNDLWMGDFGNDCGMFQDGPPETCPVPQERNLCAESCIAGHANTTVNCPDGDAFRGTVRHACLLNAEVALRRCLLDCQ